MTRKKAAILPEQSIVATEYGNKALIIGRVPCPRCQGRGELPVYSWPPTCTAECALTLRPYESGGPHFLCFRHGLLNSVLWRPEERTRALMALEVGAP